MVRERTGTPAEGWRSSSAISNPPGPPPACAGKPGSSSTERPARRVHSRFCGVLRKLLKLSGLQPELGRVPRSVPHLRSVGPVSLSVKGVAEPGNPIPSVVYGDGLLIVPRTVPQSPVAGPRAVHGVHRLHPPCSSGVRAPSLSRPRSWVCGVSSRKCGLAGCVSRISFGASGSTTTRSTRRSAGSGHGDGSRVVAVAVGWLRG